MKFHSQHQLPSWLPQLNPQVWILAVGRFLSQVGTGFTMFYAPIFFVNHIGLSSTEVGFGIGSSSISGVLGRILGGAFCDSQFWGRRRTLLLSAIISAIASFMLAASSSFHSFVAANLLIGFGIGLYWPATEAIVIDLTPTEHRNEAYALTRLADNLGLGVGIIFGGILIGTMGAYRFLFVIDGISFIVFFGVIFAWITESRNTIEYNREPLNGWKVALDDRTLLIFFLVNIIFTTYISQIQSTMPLYFKNFVSLGNSGKGFSETIISILFTWHLALSIFAQLPVTRILRRFSHPQSLTISALLWGIGFIVIYFTGVVQSQQLIWAILGMGVLAIATVAYTPSASAFVADIAPISLRGIYLSINSLCWAVGYFIGPPLGGWALEQPQHIVDQFWLSLALSVIVTIAILQYLNRIISQNVK